MFGDSLFVSMAQNVFSTDALRGIDSIDDLGMVPQAVFDAGATILDGSLVTTHRC
jgi:hypothetical protein